MRFVALFLPALLAIAACGLAPQPAEGLSLDFIGEATLPPDLTLDGTRVGGLSALAFDSRDNLLYALSDDFGRTRESAENTARLYRLELMLDDGFLDVVPASVVRFKKDGAPMEPGSMDAEAFVILPNGNYLISSERDVRNVRRHHRGWEVPPSMQRIFEFDSEGDLIREYSMPDRFNPPDWSETRGIRVNKGIEGMAIADRDGDRFATITEQPLMQDVRAGSSFCRFTIFERRAGKLVSLEEYAYQLDPLPGALPFSAVIRDSGVSEILAIGERRYLAVERSYLSDGKDQHRTIVKIYEFSLGGDATEVSAQDTLSGEINPLAKRLVLDLDELIPWLDPPPPGATHVLDNIEGMTLGPALNGQPTLILVSDDNFSDAQRTLFLAFSVGGLPAAPGPGADGEAG